jgi:hypothetical protein
MKQKKLSQKLRLKKATISNLSNQEMNMAEGGKKTKFTTSWLLSCSCNSLCAPCSYTCDTCVSVNTGCQDCTSPHCPT